MGKWMDGKLQSPATHDEMQNGLDRRCESESCSLGFCDILPTQRVACYDAQRRTQIIYSEC